MSFNGSGTYTLPGAALTTGATVSSTENNTFRNDVAAAFNKTSTRDGQTVPTANLPMGGFKHTGLAAGTTAGDSVRYEQLPSASNLVPVDSGGTGATTASAARTNLGVVIGTNVQAWDADLDTWATKTAPSGTVVGTNDTQTLTNKTLTSPTVTGAVMSSMASSVISSATAVASTSGTSIDFTSIPSWVKRVTVMFNGVSTNGSSNLLVQLGTSGGVVTSSYASGCWGANTTNTGSSAGLIATGLNGAGRTNYGMMIISSFGSNAWASIVNIFDTSNNANNGAGVQTNLGGTLDRVRITTVNGTDTFDAGSVNILYE